MRMLVCGGRSYDDCRRLTEVLDACHAHRKITVMLHGAAAGADSLAAEWASSHGIAVEQYPAAWQDLSYSDARIHMRPDGVRYDAMAGLRRNQRMLDDGKPDGVVAFPGNRGTADMIRRAKRAGVPVMQVR